MQPLNGRIAGNDKIGVVAEPLQAAIPNIAMNIIIGARGQPKKFNVPHSSQDEPNDDNAPRKSSGLAKNSRIAKRYAMPASVKEAMKYGPPRSPKLCEQMVSATHNVTPSMYTLCAGVVFTITITILPYPSEARPRLCRHKLPLFKPRRRAWRPCRSQTQLLCQPAQVVSYINIVKRICETYGKLKRPCARQKSLQRAAGAHSVACEKRRMRSLCPDEVVASVVGWSNHYVMCGQRFERVFENRTRQVWAVAVEGNGASLMTLREVRKHRRESGSQTFTFLRNDARFAACQLRQLVYVRVRAHDGNFHITQ